MLELKRQRIGTFLGYLAESDPMFLAVLLTPKFHPNTAVCDAVILRDMGQHHAELVASLAIEVGDPESSYLRP